MVEGGVKERRMRLTKRWGLSQWSLGVVLGEGFREQGKLGVGLAHSGCGVRGWGMGASHC